MDAKSLWKQVEDVVVPQLRLGMIDHLVYMHLLRHSHLEGKRRLHFSIPRLAHNINLSTCPTREAARADGSDIEQVDFLKTLELRRTIHARERGRCFYCLRRIPPRLECLDHVVPRARVGCNSYRNLVSACMECNAQKGEQPADEYLRWLFREHRLGAAELRGRFEALEMLGAGKLRPTLRSEEGQGNGQG